MSSFAHRMCGLPIVAYQRLSISVLFEGERCGVLLALEDGQMLRAFSRQPVRIGEVVPVVVHSAWRL